MIADQPPPHVVEVAIARGAASPCGKSQRGAVIFAPWSGAILGHDCNHLPGRIPCGLVLSYEDRNAANPRATFGDGEACRRACGTRCVHAEAAAILQASAVLAAAPDAVEIVHVKVVAGAAVASGPPSCVPCAALILEARIAAAWLLHAEGWRRYPAPDFYRLSCENRGLPSG